MLNGTIIHSCIFYSTSSYSLPSFAHPFWMQIAVKRLKNAKNGTEMEFTSEVEILGRIRQKNLLSFRGYCADGPERILVYDYMENSSLCAHLHGTHSAECLLDWRRRASIAIGTARALLLVTDLFISAHNRTSIGICSNLFTADRRNSQVLSHRYLHHHATPQIIHGGIKTTNVLLDSDFQAHLGDFGLIRLIPDGMDHEKITSENKRGYLAPEYNMFGKLTSGCDVYSFGIILLELASGKGQ
jgi:serine/threonine protein kinase